MSEHHQDWALVMPFVATESHGGPYQDDAFVAGYSMGLIDATLARLASGPPSADVAAPAWAGPVRTDLLPQLDLLAMRHGFVLEEGAAEDEFWTTVTLRWNG